jgi:hypothetical protein
VIINFVCSIQMRRLVLSLRLVTVPPSHGGFFQEVQQNRTFIVWSSRSHSADIIALVGWVHVDGKQLVTAFYIPTVL